MRPSILAAAPLALALLLACSSKRPTAPDAAAAPTPTATAAPPTGARTPLIPPTHELYARVEGTAFKNDCAADADCRVGGCSSEVCSAEEGVNTTCEAPAEGFPGTGSAGSACGCVSGACVWFTGGATPSPARTGTATPTP